MNVARKALLAALKVVGPATKAGHRPILHCVKLFTSGESLIVEATDVETYISTTAAAEYGSLDVTVVPFAPLLAFVANAGDEVNLIIDDDSLLVTSNHASLRLLRNQDDYPVRQIVDKEPVEVSAEQVAQLASILYAASDDRARPVLNGVCFRDGWAACTDSYRLSATKLQSGIEDCIVPAQTLETVVKHAPEGFWVASDGFRAQFTTGATSWTTRLIEGTYPNWQNLVKDSTAKLSCERGDLVGAIEQVDIFGAPWVKLERVDDKGGIRLSTQNEGDEVSAIIEGMIGVDKIAFTLKYLRDLVKATSGDLFALGLVNAQTPATIKTEERIDLLMPVRMP